MAIVIDLHIKKVVLCQDGEDLVVRGSTGRLLRLKSNDENLTETGRHVQSPVLLRLLPGETVNNAAAVNNGDKLFLGSRQVRPVMILPALELRKRQHCALGQMSLRFQNKSETLINFCEIKGDQLVSVVFRDRSNQRIDSELLRTSNEPKPIERGKRLKVSDDIYRSSLRI